MRDRFNLFRFVEAQAPFYRNALAELERGRKETHWMWFVFPQIAGLGHSSTARYFAISSLEEARAYGAHPLLGARLLECTRTINASQAVSALDLFGSPDDLKFRSSMTLFREAAEDPKPFQAALDRYFDGEADGRTLDILGDL
jgi:uncharacterized protein (DUF1810 family)